MWKLSEQNREYYIKDIHEDIMYARKLFSKIKNKYSINNKPVDEVVDGLIDMLHDIFVYAAQDHSETGIVTEKF